MCALSFYAPDYSPTQYDNADQVHQFLVHFLLSQGVAQEYGTGEASKFDIDGNELCSFF